MKCVRKADCRVYRSGVNGLNEELGQIYRGKIMTASVSYVGKKFEEFGAPNNFKRTGFVLRCEN